MINLILFFLAVQVIHFLGTWHLYQKAGRQAWEAAVPIYNAIVLTKIIRCPWWYVFVLFIPVVNVLMAMVFWVETIRAFGLKSRKDALLVILTLGFYIYYLNYVLKPNYETEVSNEPRSKFYNVTSAVLFAVIIATVIHTYVMQPFTIPTPSLESSLLVGDFLLVSKLHYGARTPSTAVSFPMVHDSIPLLKKKSYLSSFQYPSFRLPGFQKVKHNDIVCFNWPADTVYYFRDDSGRHVDKPFDKRSNYVKRCVGLPGDTLRIFDGDVFINGSKLKLHDRQKLQHSYTILTDLSFDSNLLSEFLKEQFHDKNSGITKDGNKKIFFTHISDEKVIELTKSFSKIQVIKNIQAEPDSRIFPHNQPWSSDNLGPIWIPKAGETVSINAGNINLYKRIIEIYENNKFEMIGNQIKINDQVASSYTFKQDYYWMMGDNRHNSEDSRMWGFVPYDHIIGKPVLIWMSIANMMDSGPKSIRTERLFTTVGGEGEPVSHWPYFIMLLVLYFGGEYLYNRYKKKKELEQ
jgi:signal peptidase I